MRELRGVNAEETAERAEERRVEAGEGEEEKGGGGEGVAEVRGTDEVGSMGRRGVGRER